MSLVKYNEAVTHARQLLTNWLDAGVQLFLALREIETSGDWQNGEHANFQDFLTAVFPNHVVSFDRYYNVINAINVYGKERVADLGVECCHALLHPKVTNDEAARTRVTAAIDQYIATNKAPPPRAEVQRIVRGEVQEPSPLSRSSLAIRRTSEQQETIARLRDEVATLRKENKALKRKLQRLEKPAEAAE